MEDWLTKALDKATAEGIRSGIDEKLVKCVDSLMKNEGFSKERACLVLDSSVDEYETAKKSLSDVALTV